MKKKLVKQTIKRITRIAKKWMKPMGLLWWRTDFVYFTDKKTIKEHLEANPGFVCLMKAWADWKYMEATVEFNLPALAEQSDSKIEEALVHEFTHILVREMREGDLHHEERVVSTLVRAFFWNGGSKL